MIQEDIMRMARQCFADPDGSLALLTPELTEFAALVAAAEREACAKVCDEWAEFGSTAAACAEIIRARGNK